MVPQVPSGCTGVGSDICCTALPSMPAVRERLRVSLSLRRSNGAHVGPVTSAESILRQTLSQHLPNKWFTGTQLLTSMIVYAVVADTSHSARKQAQLSRHKVAGAIAADGESVAC